jgi:glucan phosphoethanolaminetransferase (alkaline phosphatase superfamily)
LVECGDNSHPISTAAVTMMMAVTNTTIKISPELITVGYLIYLYFILLLFFLLYNLLIISFDRKKTVLLAKYSLPIMMPQYATTIL